MDISKSCRAIQRKIKLTQYKRKLPVIVKYQKEESGNRF